jgi:hypothetical protein
MVIDAYAHFLPMRLIGTFADCVPQSRARCTACPDLTSLFACTASRVHGRTRLRPTNTRAVMEFIHAPNRGV